MTTITETAPSLHRLQLRTAYGPVYRDVLSTAPREARSDEIPVIDISGIYGDLTARKALAQQIKHAAENTGFFYIKNHGISTVAIDGALEASKTFFSQPIGKKQLVSRELGKYYNGFSANGSAMASPTEGREFTRSH
jgi:isopenicillin N synthase-like dioxygenase